MSKQIITCTGYGDTGSSAITDLFKEFDNCISMGESEFWFLQDFDGVSDLEYFLIDGNHRSKVSLAIDRYKQYAIANKRFYNKFFDNQFIDYTHEYLDELVDVKFKKAISPAEVNRVQRFFYFKVLVRLQLLFKKLIAQKTYEPCVWYPMIDKTYANLSAQKFYEITKKYTTKLFNLIDKSDKYQNIIFDQLTPTNNIKRYFNYVDNLKVILVDRDPRDLYLLNKLRYKRASWLCDTSNVDEYINWYRALRIHQKNDDLNNKQILKINFEDLIYKYDETLDKLCKFANINPQHHIHKKKYFNPEVSVKNTKLYCTDEAKIYNKQIQQIAKQLKEFCYDE